MTHVIPELIRLSRAAGITIEKKANGHYQLHGGKFLVNYYPHSKKQTAYIAGTFKSVKHVTIAQAVQMCFEQPESQGIHDKRQGNSRRKRTALLRKGITTCYWCGIPLHLDNSTLEHIIPLASNGLDNANNRTLACKPCNSSRGSGMPELKGNSADTIIEDEIACPFIPDPSV